MTTVLRPKRPSDPHRRLTVPAIAVLATLGVLVLAGCGPASSSAQGGGGAGRGVGQSGAGGGRGGGQGREPGVSGLIAEIDGKTLQVQESSEQTAVTYTADTMFTQQVDATASAIAKGVCVSVRDETSNASGAASGGPSGSPGVGTQTLPSSVAASSIIVYAATKGTCAEAFGGQFGRRGSGGHGGQSELPSGAPSDVPSGAPSSEPGRGSAAGGPGTVRMITGRVTTVKGSSFTVAATARTPDQGGASARPTTPVTVTTSSSTTYTQRRKTTSAAAKVGLCARAQGRTDSSGAVTATSIALSNAVDGACTQGFGARPSGSRTGG